MAASLLEASWHVKTHRNDMTLVVVRTSVDDPGSPTGPGAEGGRRPGRHRRAVRGAGDDAGEDVIGLDTDLDLDLVAPHPHDRGTDQDRKSTRLNSSHVKISYAVFCLKKKKIH